MDEAALEVVAEPFPVQVLADGRVAPGPDVGVDDQTQFDGPRGTLVRPAARDGEQGLGEGAALPLGGAPGQGDEDVHVAGGPQPSEDGGAVETGREDGILTEGLADDAHDAAGGRVVGTVGGGGSGALGVGAFGGGAFGGVGGHAAAPGG